MGCKLTMMDTSKRCWREKIPQVSDAWGMLYSVARTISHARRMRLETRYEDEKGMDDVT